VIAPLLAAAVLAWHSNPPLPVARTEVAGASWHDQVVVVGGFTADGRSSARVDAYDPHTRSWRRLPDLPLAVNHAMAASGNGRLYVAGGYAVGETGPVRDFFVLDGVRWRRLRPLPYARAAGGAAFIGGTLYVAGGVGPYGTARSMLAYDVTRNRWRVLAGPSPREHLGVTALGRQLYVVAGRLHGQPLSIVQRWSPQTRRWEWVASMPEPRGATAASVADGEIVDAGAESAAGTSAAVYAYEPAANRWHRLPDQPIARHSLAVVGLGDTIYVVGGGPTPGLTVTGANESISLRRR
jgi:N-acetylneuraminic acid mutarotase